MNPWEYLFADDRKVYSQLVKLIKSKQYNRIFEQGLLESFTHLNFKTKAFKELEKLKHDPLMLKAMDDANYTFSFDYQKSFLESNANNLSVLVNNNINVDPKLINLALDLGYRPSARFLKDNASVFKDNSVLNKMLDLKVDIPFDMIENEFQYTVGDSESLITSFLDMGYKPSKEFIKRSRGFQNRGVVRKLLDNYELEVDDLKTTFSGNIYAKLEIISKYPKLISSVSTNDSDYERLWLEIIKDGNADLENLAFSVTSSYALMTKLIKYDPSLVKENMVTDAKQREALDNLAIAMGYIPTRSEVINSPYVQKSYTLMKQAIMHRPELIKHVGKNNDLEMEFHLFKDLAREAVKNGYVPSMEDINNNPKLRQSFDVMKQMVSNDPKCIELCSMEIDHPDWLAKLALDNGYKVTSKTLAQGIEASDSMIKERFLQTLTLPSYDDLYKMHSTNKSMDLYNFFVEHGCNEEDFFVLFTNNYEVMKEIVKKKPELVIEAGDYLSRQQIDDLCMLAIDRGYVPRDRDKVFSRGFESIKYMLEKDPNYFYKANLFDEAGLFRFKVIPQEQYDELYAVAVKNGFKPDMDLIMSDELIARKFYSNYEVMKLMILENPERILNSNIEDDDKFNELCLLALELGYKPNASTFSYYPKLASNFNMVKAAVELDPSNIVNLSVSDPVKQEELLQTAIKNGLTLSFDENALLTIFLPIPSEKLSQFLDNEFDIKIIENAKQLYKGNEDIAKTLKSGFLRNEVFEHFTPLQIEVLSCYPSLQSKIIDVVLENNHKRQLVYDLVEEFKDNMQWISILENVMNNINSSEFANLFDDLEGKELDKDSKIKLLYLLNTDNHLDISNLNDLENMDQIRDNYIKTLIKRNTVGSLKTAYLEKVFGIDLPRAMELVKVYGESLNNDSIERLTEKDKQLFLMLANMKNVLNVNNIEVLKKYIDSVDTIKSSYDLMTVFENKLKETFTKEFNNSFAKPNIEDKVTSLMADEQDYDVYYAAGVNGDKKMRMMITSIGAYTNVDEPDDYYASWNVNKIASHGVCCSYVGEKNLGTARIKYCCFGFTDYEMGSLHLSAPYDLTSFSSDKEYKINTRRDAMCLMPDDVLDYTRHTHNEIVWERRLLDENGNYKKKQPSYIVYFVDNFEDRFTDLEARKQWESVKKAAKDFGQNGKSLPIMVVEREKIARNQKEVIEDKINDFKQNLDKALIKEIVVDYESNYAGNRDYHPEISNKYFPQKTDLNETVVGRLISIINDSSVEHQEEAMECLHELYRVVEKEREKYDNMEAKAWDGEAPSSFNIDEALDKISTSVEKLKKEKLSVISTVGEMVEANRQFEVSDSKWLDEETKNSQLSKDDVVGLLSQNGIGSAITTIEKEIYHEKINEGLKVHSQRHIKDVVLFSGLIGQQVLSNPEDVKLLLFAAKYHDVARTYDGNEEHAKPSANVAKEKLKGVCSLEELAIITTAIEYHEVDRKDPSSDEIFKYIATKNGVSDDQLDRTRAISEVLKDADALDRTRFINRARLNGSYLHFPISKQLINFSAQLQENYALNDLQQYNCNDQISILLNNNTPQSVLRTIRHNTNGKMSNEEVVEFINAWSQVESQKSGGKYGK